MHNKKTYVIINFTLLIISLLFSVLAAELICRFLPEPISAGHHYLFCEYDPYLGWRHVPFAKHSYITGEYASELSFNSKGLRGPERQTPQQHTTPFDHGAERCQVDTGQVCQTGVREMDMGEILKCVYIRFM